jgi:hypothetical protein
VVESTTGSQVPQRPHDRLLGCRYCVLWISTPGLPPQRRTRCRRMPPAVAPRAEAQFLGARPMIACRAAILTGADDAGAKACHGVDGSTRRGPSLDIIDAPSASRSREVGYLECSMRTLIGMSRASTPSRCPRSRAPILWCFMTSGSCPAAAALQTALKSTEPIRQEPF